MSFLSACGIQLLSVVILEGFVTNCFVNQVLAKKTTVSRRRDPDAAWLTLVSLDDRTAEYSKIAVDKVDAWVAPPVPHTEELLNAC